MKVNSQFTGSGKIGNLVLSQRAGDTIARQYQPKVNNPSTDAQVDQRASFKLMSQLAASLAPSIAFQKQGGVSARNRFVKANFPLVSASAGVSQVTYENLQLTEGSRSLPDVVATINAGTLALSMAQPPRNVESVAYHVYKVTEEGLLEFVDSITANDTTNYSATLTSMPEGQLVIYAYGLVLLNEDARNKYGHYNVTNGSDLARLISSRKLSAGDYTTTRTRCSSVSSAITSLIPVYVTAGNGGRVTGGGSFADGSNVLVTAIPSEGFAFQNWSDQDGNYAGGIMAGAGSTVGIVPVNGQIVDIVARFYQYNQRTSPVELFISLDGALDNAIAPSWATINGQPFPADTSTDTEWLRYPWVASEVTAAATYEGATFKGWGTIDSDVNVVPLGVTDTSISIYPTAQLVAIYETAN